MLRASKAERMELYKDPDTQVLLGKFLNSEIDQLWPVYDPKLGYRYEAVEAIVGDKSKTEAFLNRLYEAGILERKLYDKIIFCPKCNSASISIHYCCPYCKSYDIQKSSLVEHVKCGYMDVEANFRKGDRFVCPKCHDELKKLDVDYRRAGVWCTCKECKKSFDIPVAELFCRECHGNFTFEDVVIKDIYSYSMKKEVKEEASLGWTLVAPLRRFLVENGFKVDAPSFLKGKSGANHMFDVVANKRDDGNEVTVIDLATSAESAVAEQPVIALFAKIFDVSPANAYLIAIPAMTENAKKMAELYNIQVIEATKEKEVVKALKEKIK